MDLEGLIRDFPDAIFAIGDDGRIAFANSEAVRLLSVDGEPLVGLPLDRFVPEQSRPAYVGAYDRFRTRTSDRFNGPGSLMVEACRTDGTTITLDLTISRGQNGLSILCMRQGDPDDTDDRRHEVSRYLDMAVRMPNVLLSVTSETEAYAAVLPALCRDLDWEVACLWVVTSEAHDLACVATWPDGGTRTEAFEPASKFVRLSVGEGLPGSACLSGGPIVASVEWLEAGVRGDAIRQLDLRAGVAFPLLSDDGVVGAIELLRNAVTPVSPRLLDTLARLGLQIGRRFDQLGEATRLQDLDRRRTFLLEAATEIAGARNYAEALDRLARAAVPTLADLCLIDVKQRDGKIVRLAALHADPAKAELDTRLGERYPPTVGSRHPSLDVMITGRSSWSPLMSDDYLRATSRDEEHFAIAKALGFESYMCVPLRYEGEVLGSMTLVSAGSGRRFRSSDLAVPEELAERAAIAVATAWRHERDHELARDLQRLLLPEKLPEFDGYEICVRYVTGAPEADAGGDFFDVVQLPSRRIGVMIGDVEGHDTTAAATMGQLRAASRVMAGQVRQPHELVDALRWSWDLLGFERIATALFCRVDQDEGTFAISSAGHLPPLLLRPEGTAEFVAIEQSTPFGAPGQPAAQSDVEFPPGSVLFCFTDGLVEQRGIGLETALKQMADALSGMASAPLSDICDAALRVFGRGLYPDDDVAILAVKRLAG